MVGVQVMRDRYHIKQFLFHARRLWRRWPRINLYSSRRRPRIFRTLSATRNFRLRLLRWYLKLDPLAKPQPRDDLVLERRSLGRGHWRDSCLWYARPPKSTYYSPLTDLCLSHSPVVVIRGSKLASCCFKPFHAKEEAIRCSQGQNPKYRGRDPADIEKQWDQEREAGTHLHRCIELFLNGKTIDNSSREWGYFRNMLDPRVNPHPPFAPHQVLRTEWRVWRLIWLRGTWFLLVGTIDAVVRSGGRRQVAIWDWKRSKAKVPGLDPIYWTPAKLLPPLQDSDLRQDELVKWGLQVGGWYQYLLEEEDGYDYEVVRRTIGRFHPTRDRYQTPEVGCYRQEILFLLDYISQLSPDARRIFLQEK